MRFSLSINTGSNFNPMMYSHWDIQDALKAVCNDLQGLTQSGFVLDIDGHTVGEWTVELTGQELALSPYDGTDDAYYRS